MLDQAIELATKRHKGQTRSSGEPYITHPLAVMEILRRYGLPEEGLICGVLHDVCEDTQVSNLDISKLFGERVGFIVNQLTKNKLPETEQLQKEYEELAPEESNTYESLFDYMDFRFQLYLNRFSVGIIADPRIMFIKIADQIHNFQTMYHCSPAKIHRKIREIDMHYMSLYHSRLELLTEMYKAKYWRMIHELFIEIDKHKKILKNIAL